MKRIPTRERGEEMNVRKVHGSLWRELSEPREQSRRIPWFLKHFFAMLIILAIIYMINQVYDWREYEVNPKLRLQRDLQPGPQPTPATPPAPAKP